MKNISGTVLQVRDEAGYLHGGLRKKNGMVEGDAI